MFLNDGITLVSGDDNAPISSPHDEEPKSLILYCSDLVISDGKLVDPDFPVLGVAYWLWELEE